MKIRRRRTPGAYRAVCCAVSEDCAHAAAVNQWIDTLVLGHGLCPWAGPARDQGGLRVVTSSATSEEGVLQDLVSEARRLPCGSEKDIDGSDKSATTLLVCPHVAEWERFDAFSTFFAEELHNGYALSDAFDVKVVAFHPNFRKRELVFEEGDTVTIAGPDGITIVGTISELDAGVDDEGQKLSAIELDDGEEWLVGRSSILRVVQTKNKRNDIMHLEMPGDPASLVMSAPRPILHLLRLQDLDRAGEVEGAEAAVMDRNREHAQKLGDKQYQELIRSCG